MLIKRIIRAIRASWRADVADTLGAVGNQGRAGADSSGTRGQTDGNAGAVEEDVVPCAEQTVGGSRTEARCASAVTKGAGRPAEKLVGSAGRGQPALERVPTSARREAVAVALRAGTGRVRTSLASGTTSGAIATSVEIEAFGADVTLRAVPTGDRSRPSWGASTSASSGAASAVSTVAVLRCIGGKGDGETCSGTGDTSVAVVAPGWAG